VTLHYRRQTGSTNEIAKALAEAGAACGTAVLAREQMAGRGRLGRHWTSPPGNLHLSVVLRPAVPAGRAAELGLVVAVAVAETLDAWLPPAGTRLKWPNDVLVDGAKIAGILLEGRVAVGTLAWAVVGIGLNLACAPTDAPYPATSVAASGRRVRPGAAARRLLGALGRCVALWQRDGLAPLRAAWGSRGHRPGDPIAVRDGEAWLQGRFLGLDADGALLLETASGGRRITSGQMSS
jgi:BirA family biotin operon repressor/biotin-[acetyl-CoA-carboxylase] ligase